MYYYFKISFSNVISIIGLILSALTLILGYLAYRKFLVKQASSKQLDLVLELIRLIHEAEISLTTMYRDDDGSYGAHYQRGNVFEFAAYGVDSDKDENEETQEFNYKIIIPVGYKFEFKPSIVMLNNPLLPRAIAEALYDFGKIKPVFSLKKELPLKTFMILGNLEEGKSFDEKFLIISTYVCNVNDFIRNCKRIKNEIQLWLKKYGLRDINEKIIKRGIPFH